MNDGTHHGLYTIEVQDVVLHVLRQSNTCEWG